jgi:hypothetical protein
VVTQRETERIPPQDAKSQGDIIRVEWPKGEFGPNLGVVINADCDLAHSKTDGVITFLPIYSFHDYLSLFWAPGQVQGVVVSSTKSVLELVNDADAEGLQAWLRASGPDVVCSSLVEVAKLKKNLALKLERELRRLAIAQDDELSAITRFQRICAAESDPLHYARIQITSAKTTMGEGHFFISDLVDEHSVGFVVRMRRIYTIPDGDYFLSTSEQRTKNWADRPTAIRVARLTELYRFKVLQLFAQQYSRIGLPDEVTALSALAIDDLVTTIIGESL